MAINISLYGLEYSFAYLIGLYSAGKAISAYKLHHRVKPENFAKLSVLIELKQKYDKVELQQNLSRDAKTAIYKFASTLENRFSKEDLINFYNNINEARIKKRRIYLIAGVQGLYNYRENKLSISNLKLIFHELLHLASSAKDEERGIYRSGFHTVKYRGKMLFSTIGRGINEGYTELLTRRYFEEQSIKAGDYNSEVEIAGHLEEIVGRDKMEKMYLHADLEGLVEELKKYSSKQDTIDFISNVDALISSPLESISPIPSMITKSILKKIYKYLFKTFVTKQIIRLENDEIDYEQYSNIIREYEEKLGEKVKVGLWRYKALSEDTKQEILEEAENIISTSKHR